jgi:hypothetical protein
MSSPRSTVSPFLARAPIIAVLRTRHAVEYKSVIDALCGGEARSIELTLSTPGVQEELPPLGERAGIEFENGPIPDLLAGVSSRVGVQEALVRLDAGALAVSIGRAMLQGALSGGTVVALEERAANLVRVVHARAQVSTGEGA